MNEKGGFHHARHSTRSDPCDTSSRPRQIDITSSFDNSAMPKKNRIPEETTQLGNRQWP
jgi:hypothetical protein